MGTAAAPRQHEPHGHEPAVRRRLAARDGGAKAEWWLFGTQAKESPSLSIVRTQPTQTPKGYLFGIRVFTWGGYNRVPGPSHGWVYRDSFPKGFCRPSTFTTRHSFRIYVSDFLRRYQHYDREGAPTSRFPSFCLNHNDERYLPSPSPSPQRPLPIPPALLARHGTPTRLMLSNDPFRFHTMSSRRVQKHIHGGFNFLLITRDG